MISFAACGPDEADPSWPDADFAYLAPIPGVESSTALALQLGSSQRGEPLPIDPRERVTSNEIAWSPSGDAIAYVASDDAEPYPPEPPELRLAKPRGSELVADGFAVIDATTGALVVTGDAGAGSPSPDGRYLSVLRVTDTAVTLGLLEVDTQETTTIGPGWSLAWRPEAP